MAKLKQYTDCGSAPIDCPASSRPQEYYMIHGCLRECFNLNILNGMGCQVEACHLRERFLSKVSGYNLAAGGQRMINVKLCSPVVRESNPCRGV